jgi:NAD(P)-dependent dehydrogenase (short-subunit alcohol dehydrogenase family)
LIVEVTEGDMLFGGGNAVSSTVKSSLKAFATAMASELRPHRVAAIAITPGFLRSESMLQHFGVTEDNWRDGGKKDKHFLQSETPLFLGRAVAALAADPNVLERSGDILSSWEVGRDYGIADADGRRPDWGAYFAQILPEIGFVEPVQRYAAFLERMKGRADRYLQKHAVGA